YPARPFVTTSAILKDAVRDIEDKLEQRLKELEANGKVLEAARLKQRTMYDIEMMQEAGYCAGIENYSMHLSRRKFGEQPSTLLDYFPDDFLMFVDESHMTLPQVRGMFGGDRSRKDVLVEHGFRLPSARENRPLTFPEFIGMVHQAVFVSATPGPYEYEHSSRVVEQVIRPTGLLDPQISVRQTKGQIDDLVGEINARIQRGERALVTTLTKRMAEDLADYLKEMGIRTHYIHSEVDTFERVEILRDLRLGVYDVVVGINLLREGLDLPEVSLVAILDADKEGFLRSQGSLIQTMGRAARNVNGMAVLYADVMTDSMRNAIEETTRRRATQEAYNKKHGIIPQTIIKPVDMMLVQIGEGDYVDLTAGEAEVEEEPVSVEEIGALVVALEEQMRAAAREFEFENAAKLRDRIKDLRQKMLAG